MGHRKWELGKKERVVGWLWPSQHGSCLLILTTREWEEARGTIRLHPT
jgi:hypothetical protein